MFPQRGRRALSRLRWIQCPDGRARESTTDTLLLQTALPRITGLVARLESSMNVADMGCGSGHAINIMAGAFPASRFTGFDITEEALAAGRAEAARLGLSNAGFVARDISRLDLPGAFDLITVFDAIHDQARPAEALQSIADALRPDGTLLMQDIRASSTLKRPSAIRWGRSAIPSQPMHCMTVSLAYNSAGLGAMWGAQAALRMLAEAGFTQVEVKPVPATSSTPTTSRASD